MALGTPLISSVVITKTGGIDSLISCTNGADSTWSRSEAALTCCIAVGLEVGAALLELLAVGVAAATPAPPEGLAAATFARVFCRTQHKALNARPACSGGYPGTVGCSAPSLRREEPYWWCTGTSNRRSTRRKSGRCNRTGTCNPCSTRLHIVPYSSLLKRADSESITAGTEVDFWKLPELEKHSPDWGK